MIKDEVLAKEKWEFDKEVTECFDDMLERSIPQYPVMRQAVTELAMKYVQEKTTILDLGASKGEAVEPLIRKFGAHNHFILVEKSEPMYLACRKRFEGLINVNVVSVRNTDLRFEFPKCKASVILSVLTLMFIPVNYRQNIIRKCYENLEPGGALIFVEKILGNSAELDQIMIEVYHNLKAGNGYDQEKILRKALSLEGVLVPLTAKWNEMMLHEAGFRYVDSFWRWMNFAGWIAIK